MDKQELIDICAALDLHLTEIPIIKRSGFEFSFNMEKTPRNKAEGITPSWSGPPDIKIVIPAGEVNVTDQVLSLVKALRTDHNNKIDKAVKEIQKCR